MPERVGKRAPHSIKRLFFKHIVSPTESNTIAAETPLDYWAGCLLGFPAVVVANTASGAFGDVRSASSSSFPFRRGVCPAAGAHQWALDSEFVRSSLSLSLCCFRLPDLLRAFFLAVALLQREWMATHLPTWVSHSISRWFFTGEWGRGSVDLWRVHWNGRSERDPAGRGQRERKDGGGIIVV